MSHCISSGLSLFFRLSASARCQAEADVTTWRFVHQVGKCIRPNIFAHTVHSFVTIQHCDCIFVLLVKNLSEQEKRHI